MEMNWIENLRSLLNLARSEYEMGKDQAAPFSGSWAISILSESAGRVDLCLKDALAIIPNEPEMIKLLRCLSKKRFVRKKGILQDSLYRPGYEKVIAYIELEFGYSLPEEEQ